MERGREHGDITAVTTGSQLLLSLPEELRPQLDPPLPDLAELLEQCERADQPFTAMTVLGVSRATRVSSTGTLWGPRAGSGGC